MDHLPPYLGGLACECHLVGGKFTFFGHQQNKRLNPLAVLRRIFDGPGGLRWSIACMGTYRDSCESLALFELDLTIENINFGALFWKLQCSMV